jgi:hypothetical protein
MQNLNTACADSRFGLGVAAGAATGGVVAGAGGPDAAEPGRNQQSHTTSRQSFMAPLRDHNQTRSLKSVQSYASILDALEQDRKSNSNILKNRYRYQPLKSSTT